MIKGLSGATIWSEDLNRLLPFYRDVLGLPVKMQTPGFVVFGTDGAPALGLGTHSEVRGRSVDSARHMVGLATDDLNADWKRLKAAGVGFIEDPKNYGNLWIATLTDPDGNLVQLFQPVATKVEALAKQFEAKRSEAVAELGKLSDADWKKVTEAEKWTVAATAHHVASSFEPIAGLIVGIVSGKPGVGIVSGKPGGSFTRGMLDEMNAAHAKEFASCTKAETIALLEKGAATAASTVRGLSDDQLAKRGVIFADVPPMSAEEVIMGGLIGHIDEHFGSIRKTVGR